MFAAKFSRHGTLYGQRMAVGVAALDGVQKLSGARGAKLWVDRRQSGTGSRRTGGRQPSTSLFVDVVSSAEFRRNAARLARLDKVSDLLATANRYVWVVRMKGPRRVEIHEPNKARRVVRPGRQLQASGVLKNALPVEALYEPRAAHQAATWTISGTVAPIPKRFPLR